MLIIFQVLFTLFALFAILGVFYFKKEGKLSSRVSGLWIVFWLAASLVVLWPESTSKVAESLGIGRGADFVLYVSIVVIFYLLFKLNVKLDSMNRDITKVVRKDALEKSDKLVK